MSLPQPFIQSLQGIKGFDESAFKKLHETGLQVTSVRMNPAKPVDFMTLPIANKVPWNDHGFYLSERPSFTGDPLFHAGAYYVQEASSMFLQQALLQSVDGKAALKVLDLCAAPGGKSTLLQAIISSESLLVSNEVIKTRVNILTENITKWGAANVVVTNNDPKDFQRLPGYFDVVVVDAPCSGSGLFRKDADAIEEWSLNNVQLCSQRQQRILADVLPALKTGGILIYSTCSYSKEEDEIIGDWLIQEFDVKSIPLTTGQNWGIVETISTEKTYGYRFYPDKVKGEGFFISVFQKTGDTLHETITGNTKKHPEKLNQDEIAVVSPWLKNPEQFFYIKQNDEIIAVPLHIRDDLQFLQSGLYIKKAGVRMGMVIRKELIPHHELALSTIISDKIPVYYIDLSTALQYLRKQDIRIDSTTKGWALVKYNQLSLGWVKILPNRVNNYYPKEWRILNK